MDFDRFISDEKFRRLMQRHLRGDGPIPFTGSFWLGPDPGPPPDLIAVQQVQLPPRRGLQLRKGNKMPRELLSLIHI